MNYNGIIRFEAITKNNKLEILIQDNGGGMPKEIISNLYTPFITTKTEGYGLGLTIIKKIIDAHNGKIKIENTKIGVKVKISLPK